MGVDLSVTRREIAALIARRMSPSRGASEVGSHAHGRKAPSNRLIPSTLVASVRLIQSCSCKSRTMISAPRRRKAEGALCADPESPTTWTSRAGTRRSRIPCRTMSWSSSITRWTRLPEVMAGITRSTAPACSRPPASSVCTGRQRVFAGLLRGCPQTLRTSRRPCHRAVFGRHQRRGTVQEIVVPLPF